MTSLGEDVEEVKVLAHYWWACKKWFLPWFFRNFNVEQLSPVIELLILCCEAENGLRPFAHQCLWVLFTITVQTYQLLCG